MNYTPEQEQMWNHVIEVFRTQIQKASFDAWVKPMKLFAVTSNEVIVTFEDAMSQSVMVNRYRQRVETLVRTVFGMDYSLKLIDSREAERQQQLVSEAMLNPKYTFETFVTGPSNSFAYAASLAVAEQPSEVYNPLFLYGDVGLGKTHLMNAIGNFIMAERPMSRVLLTTSERFTNELIDAIVKKKGTAELRAKMRNVDVLMVDDIQFLSKTTATQEEFFHTFNDLYNNGKQIIISSDRPPNELPTIEERLRSRFGSGLIVDIQKPDFETRVAILRKKADEENIDLPADVAEYIAAHFDKSIRELEGALTRVFAQSKLLGYAITMDLAAKALDSLVQTQDTRVVTPKIIIDTVARRYDIPAEDILSKKRNREIAVPRQVAIYICRELTDLSTTNIGREFGNRDHTTVMHSCDKVAEQMKSDIAFRKRIEELIELVKSA